MAITYPVALSALPAAEIELATQGVPGLNVSPYTLGQEAFEWPGNRWLASVRCRAMQRAEADTLFAELVSLYGAGTFLFGPVGPEATPRGLGPLSGELPFVMAQTASVSTLTTRGWGASRNGVLLPGDFFSIARNQLTRSNEFDHADWVKAQTGTPGLPVVTANAVAEPVGGGGGSEADQIDFPATAGGEQSIIKQVISSATLEKFKGRTAYFFCWLKASASVNIDQVVATDLGETSNTRALTTSWQPFTTSRAIGAGAAAMEVSLVQRASQSAKTVFAYAGILYSTESDIWLYQNLATVDSVVTAPINFWPRLRVPLPDFSPILTSSPKGIFRLKGMPMKVSQPGGVFQMQFDAEEVF